MLSTTFTSCGSSSLDKLAVFICLVYMGSVTGVVKLGSKKWQRFRSGFDYQGLWNMFLCLTLIVTLPVSVCLTSASGTSSFNSLTYFYAFNLYLPAPSQSPAVSSHSLRQQDCITSFHMDATVLYHIQARTLLGSSQLEQICSI